ncbi:hypothetical protein BH10PSE11_BH10PSE11_27560 [soil metagenome]
MLSLLRIASFARWLMLLALALPALANDADSPPMYWTADELLAGVNARLATVKRPAFTMDELTVVLVAQARQRSRYDLFETAIPDFLKKLVNKQRFDHPVMLSGYAEDSINLSANRDSPEYLQVPSFQVLEVHILNVPWGSVDADGNNLKITWDASKRHA